MNPLRGSSSTVLVFFASIFLAFVSTQTTYQGCYVLDKTLNLDDTSIYQSLGRCSNQICTPHNYAVFGMSGNQCWCGNAVPPQQVPANDCNTACSGYPNDTCGGIGYISVWLTGVGHLVGNAATQILSATPTASSTSAPSIVTVVTTGQTTVVATPTKTGSPSSGGVSGGAAAGIAVGVLAAVAIAGGAFFYIRRRRKEEYQEAYENAGLGSSPGTINRPFGTDHRLEPTMVQRRQSVGSLADDRDYTRKILRVTNPDGT